MKKELLALVKKYRIPLTQINKEVLIDEDLLKEASDYLYGDVLAPFGFPGFIFRWKGGKGLDTDERKVEALRNEYGIEAELWEPPEVQESDSIFLEPDVRYARPVLLSSLTVLPRRLVVVTRESVLISLIAEPGWREYSPITVVANAFFEVDDVFRVENQAFFPPGKSSLGMAFLRLRRPYPRIKEFTSFLKEVFTNKRKRIESHGKRPSEMYPDELLEYFETTQKR